MKRDDLHYVNIVIEESGIEGDLEYKPVLATLSDMKAKLKARELYRAKTYDKLSRPRWEQLKSKLDEYLANVDEKEWDDNDMYQSDAELIFNFVDSNIPLDVLSKAEDVYENQDPYYEVKIFKMKLE
jgi:hypothetical protein